MSDRTTEHLRHEFMASHGIVSIALDFRSGDTDPYPASAAGHQLRRALGQASRPRSQDPAGTDRPFRPVERRPSGDAGRDAAERSALCRDRAAGRRAGAGRERALRRDVVAGDQSAVAATATPSARWPSANPPEWPKTIIARQDSYWRSEANMAEGNPMLALERGEKVLTAAGDLVPGPRRHACTTTRTRIRTFPATSRSALSPITTKPAATIELQYIEMDRHAGHSPDLTQDRRHVRADGEVQSAAHIKG